MALTVVPGLLQTADYTRALMAAGQGLDDARVERIVASRAERQRLLDRPHAPRMSFVLDVLCCCAHRGAGIRAEAGTRHARGRTTLGRGPGPPVGARRARRSALGRSRSLRFPAWCAPDVVFVENRIGDAVFENEVEVTDNFARIFDELRQVGACTTSWRWSLPGCCGGSEAPRRNRASPAWSPLPGRVAYLCVDRPPLRGSRQ